MATTYSSSTEVAKKSGTVSSVRSPRGGPKTEYVYVATDAKPSYSGSAGRAGSGRSVSYTGNRQKRVPSGYPRMLGDSRTIVIAWGVAMAIISWDEWHNNGILPRPQRLWYTSLTFMLLTALSFSATLFPIAQALAIGFVIMLLWQYYNKAGQFAS